VHFIRSHSGSPDIDPKLHRLHIHGLVERPLRFSVEALSRYPMTTRIYFIECSGNSLRALSPQPAQVPAGGMHGNVSCNEWTGVPLRVLLDEAGVQPQAKWLLAEGADSAHMSRSVPLEKALDDALIALYQNGERLRPEHGYPVRLLLPGWEGNMSVKWLRRIKLTDGPTHTKDETSKYTDPLPDGRALQFTYEMGVKSVITRPSATMKLAGTGFHEISGIAWSGAGRIRRVEVSTDGGQTWAEAALTGAERSKALVRFRYPWQWKGAGAVLQSRATDEKGNVQPARREWQARFAPDIRFHNNSIVSWGVETDGSVKNVYA
jgi:sulfane dehydrogenase subunit SoxC